MKRSITRAICLSFICLSSVSFAPCYAQQSKEDALEKGRRALRLMDEEQKYEEAIRLLQESVKLDPSNTTYPYEIAYGYYLLHQYDKAIAQLIVLKEKPDVHDRVYQLLGNSYDLNKQGTKAMDVYEEGLKKFPKSGELHLELGVMMLKDKNYNKALDYFEKGIKADPAFPSNYYWASKIFCSSDEEMWGMMYGEIFMNLERSTKRTDEISKMLYDVYTREIQISDSGSSVSFSKNIMEIKADQDIKKMKLPYGMIYEGGLAVAVAMEKSIDINSLDRIRQHFISNYFSNDRSKDYPNVLFDYQWKVKKAGHAEAYNHWLLQAGDETAFNKWHSANKEKWEKFAAWFSSNELVLDQSHYFSRSLY